MLRKIVLLSLSLTLSTLSMAQPMVGYFLAPQNDLSKGRNFSKIEETSEVIIRGRVPIPHQVEKHFNSAGMITSEVVLNSAGGRTSETTWEYFDGNKVENKKHKFFMNIKGWNEEEVKIEWDESTKLPKRIDVIKNGTLWQWALISIDTLGRIESAKVFGSTGAHIYTERLIYLEPSNMIKVVVYKANGLFSSTVSYPIDPKKPFSVESVSRQYYPNGDIMLDTLSEASKGDQAYYYEYEYDSQGNWIEKRTYQVTLGRNNKLKDKNLENKITRKITYQ